MPECDGGVHRTLVVKPAPLGQVGQAYRCADCNAGPFAIMAVL